MSDYEESRALQCLFNILDRDGNGYLTFDELDAFSSALTAKAENMAERNAVQYMVRTFIS